jgi:hypothetical protein
VIKDELNKRGKLKSYGKIHEAVLIYGITENRQREDNMQLRSLKNANILLILPCNAAACIGNYFRAETYSKNGWNTWREADKCLSSLRAEGTVAFAALDSSILETEPRGSKGAIVFETEMHRAKNPTGEDWGAPNWRWFKPTKSGKCEYLEALTESLVKGVRRVEKMGFSQVFALVNPRGYFLSLAAAVDKCGLLNEWILFQIPSHPRYLLSAVRQAAPFVRAAAEGKKLRGGIYPIPELYPFMQKENKRYKDSLPKTWKEYSQIINFDSVKKRWAFLRRRF